MKAPQHQQHVEQVADKIGTVIRSLLRAVGRGRRGSIPRAGQTVLRDKTGGDPNRGQPPRGRVTQITPQTTFKQWLKANHHGNPRAQKLLTDNAIPDRWVVDMGDLDEILKVRYPDGELRGFDVDQLWFDYREQMMEAGANPFAQYVEMVADEARFGHREDHAANLADEFLAEEHVLQHRFETIEDYIARRPELEDSVAPILEDLYIEWCVRYTEAHIQDCISGEAEPEDSPAVTPVGEMRKNSKDQYDMGEYAGTVYQHKDSYYSYLDGQSGMEGPFPTFEQAMGDLQTRVNL